MRIKRCVLVFLLVASFLAITSAAARAAPPPAPSLQQPPPPEAEATQTVPTEDGQEENGQTDLSTEIGQFLGTLGLYAALMAVLAAGAEVVLDIVKSALGLETKPAALSTLEEMRTWMPGALEQLGVSTADQQRLDQTITEMSSMLERVMSKDRLICELKLWTTARARDVAVEGLNSVWAKHWPTLRQRLQDDYHVSGATLTTVQQYVRMALESVSHTNAQTYLDTLSALLQGVENRRNEVQSLPRKWWRSIRNLHVGNKWVMKWLAYVEYLWAALRGQRPEGGRHLVIPGKTVSDRLEHLHRWARDNYSLWPQELQGCWMDFVRDHAEDSDDAAELKALNKLSWDVSLRLLGRAKSVPSEIRLEDAARLVFDMSGRHYLAESTRVSSLRVLSVVVGIALAAMLRIDSLQLLAPLLGDASAVFTQPVEVASTAAAETATVEWLSFGQYIQRSDPDFDARLGLPWVLGNAAAWLFALTPGIVLSGLGAAAGSKFWHDQLDRLQKAKTATTQIVQAVEQVKLAGAGGGGNGQNGA